VSDSRPVAPPPDYPRPDAWGDFLGRLIGSFVVMLPFATGAVVCLYVAAQMDGAAAWIVRLLGHVCVSYGYFLVWKAFTVETAWQRWDREREARRR
jgi:hypothetical protein